MAYTKENLAAVQKAIAGGVLEVRYGDKVVRYQSTNELLQVEQRILASLRGQEGRRQSRIIRLRSGGKGI